MQDLGSRILDLYVGSRIQDPRSRIQDQPLAGCGCLWLPLPASGCPWLAEAASGCLWLPLAVFWLRLAVSACLWLSPPDSGCLCLPLAASAPRGAVPDSGGQFLTQRAQFLTQNGSP